MASQILQIPRDALFQVRSEPLVDDPPRTADYDRMIVQYYPRIHRAALLMTGTVCDAEDLAQETFLQAMQSWPRFAGKSRVDTWLYAILVNLHRKSIRSRTRAWRRALDWFFSRSAHETGDEAPDGPMQMREWRQTLWSRVAQLPEHQRHAVVLRYAEGLNYAQIAEALDCPVGTVKSRLHHALAALRNRLGNETVDDCTPTRDGSVAEALSKAENFGDE